MAPELLIHQLVDGERRPCSLIQDCGLLTGIRRLPSVRAARFHSRSSVVNKASVVADSAVARWSAIDGSTREGGRGTSSSSASLDSSSSVPIRTPLGLAQRPRQLSCLRLIIRGTAQAAGIQVGSCPRRRSTFFRGRPCKAGDQFLRGRPIAVIMASMSAPARRTASMSALVGL